MKKGEEAISFLKRKIAEANRGIQLWIFDRRDQGREMVIPKPVAEELVTAGRQQKFEFLQVLIRMRNDDTNVIRNSNLFILLDGGISDVIKYPEPQIGQLVLLDFQLPIFSEKAPMRILRYVTRSDIINFIKDWDIMLVHFVNTVELVPLKLGTQIPIVGEQSDGNITLPLGYPALVREFIWLFSAYHSHRDAQVVLKEACRPL